MSNKSTVVLLQGALIGAIAVELVRILYNQYVAKPTGPSTASDEPSGKAACAGEDVNTDRIGTPHPSVLYPAYRDCIYADYNATTPIFEEVRDAIIPFTLEHFGNPSSSHVFGASSKVAIDMARSQVMSLLDPQFQGGLTRDIVFTSCGTESDNGAITIALHHYNSRPKTGRAGADGLPQVIASSIEHPGILKHLQHLQTHSVIELCLLPVDSQGFVCLEQLRVLLGPTTALVTIMHSNNEVGVIQSLRVVADLVRASNAECGADTLFHSDVAQSLGKVMVDVRRLGIDMCTVVGHKFGAPKGVGALFIDSARPVPIRTCALTHGGGQEFGIRSGTESVLLITSLGAASALARRETRLTCIHVLRCKKRFMHRLEEQLSARGHLRRLRLRYNGPAQCATVSCVDELLRALGNALVVVEQGGASDVFDDLLQQLPNTVSVSFAGLKSHEILAEIQGKVACSAGSACHGTSAGVTISDVLSAMQVPVDAALGTLRLSFGRHSLLADVDIIVDTIVDALEKLAGNSGA